MRKIVICFFIILLQDWTATAQSLEFNKIIYVPTDTPCGYGTFLGEGAHSILEFDDGYLILGHGNRGSLNCGLYSSFITRTDLEGNLVTTKEYGKDSMSFWSGLWGSLKQFSKNKYIYASNISDHTKSPINSIVLVQMVNQNGDTIWTRKWDTNSGFDAAYDCTILANKNILISASKKINGTIDYWLIRIDSTGKELWQKSFGSNRTDYAFKIDQFPNTDYLISGFTNQFNFPNYGPELIRLDTTGNIRWSQNYGTGGDECSSYARVTSDSGIILTSCQDTVIVPDHYVQPAYIAKLDSLGEVTWKVFPHPEEIQQIHTIKEVSDNSYVFCGTKYDTVALRFLGWIGKVSKSGNMLWQRKFTSPVNNGCHLNHFQETSDGGLIFGGDAFDSENHTKIWLLKTDANGCFAGDCGLSVGIEETAPPLANNDVIIYPNPANDRLIIESATADLTGYRMYNMVGQEVMYGCLQQGGKKAEIHTAPFPQGYYILTVEQGAKKTAHKISILH